MLRPLSRVGLVVLSTLRVGCARLCSAPPKIVVPKSKMQIAHSRSSGPGGQNVNKVNTKVELRFHVPSADWIPPDVKARLIDDNMNRMNKEGELIVTAQESRSQASNMELALTKVQEMVDLACIPPKVRPTARDISPAPSRVLRASCGPLTPRLNLIRVCTGWRCPSRALASRCACRARAALRVVSCAR